MESNKVHMELVKRQLQQIHRIRDARGHGLMLDMGHAEKSLEKGDRYIKYYKRYRESDPDYNSMIGAYYENCNYFFYIEKIGNKYWLTRHLDGFERKTILRKNEVDLLLIHGDLELSHFNIIGVIWYMDMYKGGRLGL